MAATSVVTGLDCGEPEPVRRDRAHWGELDVGVRGLSPLELKVEDMGIIDIFYEEKMMHLLTWMI
jgi:hypothetical protein